LAPDPPPVERVDQLGIGGRNAIALIVKSRRDGSVSMSSANATSGLRLSGRYTSAGTW
jgi:hypothetical protein